MKKLAVIFTALIFVAASASANPVFKNRKAQDGAFVSGNVVMTTPISEMNSPAMKNVKPGVDLSQGVEVINPEVDHLKGPEAKNQNLFKSSSPSIEVGEPVIID